MARSNSHPSSTASSTKAKPKPQPKDLSHHFSTMAKLRVQSSIAPFESAITASVFNLGAGFPFAGNFPADSLEGAIAKTNRFPLFPVSPLSPPSTDISRFTVPKFSSITPASINPDEEIDLATALQYQSSTGYPSLAAFINDFALSHQNQGKIPYAGPETLMTGGAVDGFSKCLSTFADSGDNILMEEIVYFQARDMIAPFGVGIVPIKLDDGGIEVDSLEDTLNGWDEKTMGKKPHMMYTVSLGQNPTGSITSLERKKKLYNVFQKHDILIFEDDPYWSLQYDISAAPSTDFLASLAPSYLQIDVDGRVLGIQTFTKVVAPGCRTGWIVAQPAFIEKLTFLTDNTTSNPSGFGEAVLAQLFKQWGVNGFVRWIEGLKVNYEQRRNVLCEALAEGRDLIVSSHIHVASVAEEAANGHKKRKRASETSSEDGRYPNHKSEIRMYDFRIPPGGFYIWVEFDFSSHPLYHRSSRHGKVSPSDLIQLLWKHLIGAPYYLLTLPGNVFAATPEVEKEFDAKGVGHLRLTFAAVEVRDLAKVGELFGKGVKTFWEGEGWEVDDLKEGAGVKMAVKQYLSTCKE